MAARNDEGLYAKARSLFISRATMDDFTGWATPRQTEAVSRLFDTELANRERSKRERLLRRAKFPVVKGLDGYDFSNVRLRTDTRSTGCWTWTSCPARRTWCSTARPAGARHTSRSGWA